MKYTRLIIGVVTLFSVVLFMGTKHSSGYCYDCTGLDNFGYVEVWNDTPFHIGIILFYSEKSAQTFVLKHDPGMIRKAFVLGRIAVAAYTIMPITEEWIFHKWYPANISIGETVIIRVKGQTIK